MPGDRTAVGIHPVQEIQSLFRDFSMALRAGRWPLLALGACSLSVAADVLSRIPDARPDLLRVGGAMASQSFGAELARLPLATFLPTSDLPVWGAVLQLLLVVAMGELLFGRVWTAVVGMAGQIISTLIARGLIAIGTGYAIGLPLSQAHILDTGPSGLTVAIGAWLLVRHRDSAAAILLGLALTGFAVGQRNLDGMEHEAAYLIGIAVAGLAIVRDRLTVRTEQPLAAGRGELT